MPKPKSDSVEVVAADATARRSRRRFTAAHKARILEEADACTGDGDIGELLRREGIYHSHLTRWRAEREQRGAEALAPRQPGPKPAKDAKDHRIEKLQRRNARLERENRIQKALLEMQVKAHEILGVALPRIEDNTTDDSSDLSSSSDSAHRRSR